jgi:hypothetical protein
MSKSGASYYKKPFAEAGVGWLNRLMYTTIGGLGSTLLGALFWLILTSILEVNEHYNRNIFSKTE